MRVPRRSKQPLIPSNFDKTCIFTSSFPANYLKNISPPQPISDLPLARSEPRLSFPLSYHAKGTRKEANFTPSMTLRRKLRSGIAPLILYVAMDGSNWPNSIPGRFNLRERKRSTGGWVGPRAPQYVGRSRSKVS